MAPTTLNSLIAAECGDKSITDVAACTTVSTLWAAIVLAIVGRRMSRRRIPRAPIRRSSALLGTRESTARTFSMSGLAANRATR